MDRPTVIVHIDVTGDPMYYTAEGVRMLVIDDRAPDDRVYEISTTLSSEEQRALVGDGDVGSINDARHPALAARIVEALGGAHRLQLVED